MADEYLGIVWQARLAYSDQTMALDYSSIIEILHFRRPDGSEYFYIRESLLDLGAGDEPVKLKECADRKTAIAWAANYLKRIVTGIAPKP